jgi:enoyl-CoA hydratase/carnithine racemase
MGSSGEQNGVRWSIEGRVAQVVLDLPPVNIVGADLIVGLSALLPALAGAEVTVAVFRSADPDFFLMHGDVELLVKVPASEPVEAVEPNIAAALFQQLHTAPYLTIGVVDGAARGGGCELLSALDLRIGTPRTVIGQPEVPMGILPGAGGTSRWPHIAGRARALEVILTGRDLDAEEAFAVGWLDDLVAVEELDARVDALATRVGAMPPASVAAVKRVVDRSLRDGVVDSTLTAETDEMGRLTAAGAHIEPMRRFLAAGGQTREAETGSVEPLIEAMLRG